MSVGINLGITGNRRAGGWNQYAVLDQIPAFVADYIAGRFRGDGLGTSFANSHEWTVTGNALMTDQDGTLKWAPHNLVHNSEAPALQNRTIVTGAQYTVECQGSGSVALSSGGAGTATEGSPATFTATTTDVWLSVTGDVTRMWMYRSDCNGMAPVPSDQRIEGLSTYVPSPVGAAAYLPRRNHYINCPKIYWIGDSFLNGEGICIATAALIEPKNRISYTSDGVGGSSMTQQAIRFASTPSVYYNDTLIIMDGGFNDATTADGIAAIDDMVARLGHDRWLYVEPAPPNTGTLAAIRATTAAIRAHVGERHFVPTYEAAIASGDGSATDNDQIALGLWPVSLTVSAVDFHPNQAGINFIAQQVYAKLAANGWVGNAAAVEKGGLLVESAATTNLLTWTMFNAETPTNWPVNNDTGTRSLTTLYGAPAMRFVCSTERENLRQTLTLAASTTYTASARVENITEPLGAIIGVYNFSDVTGTQSATAAEIDREGYVSITFTTGADTTGEIRFGIGLDANRSGELVFSELMLNTGTTRLPWVPTNGSTVTRPSETVRVKYQALPVSAGMPSAISLHISGKMTYADTDAGSPVTFVDWSNGAFNRILLDLRDNAGTGQLRAFQYAGGDFDTVLSGGSIYTPGWQVPFNVASRHSTGVLNGAADGVSFTANLTPLGLPTTETTNMTIGGSGSGPLIVQQHRVWAVDLTDAGIEAASS